MDWIYGLLILLAILNIGDGLSTYRFVKLDGIEAEGNDMARRWMRKIGVVPTIILFKGITQAVWIALTAVAFYTGMLDHPTEKTIWAFVIGAGCVWLAWTIVGNMDWDDRL